MEQVTVIGGGSAGLRLARKLAERKVSVTVLEDHKEIGIPEHCSGLISAKNTKELGFDISQSLTNNIKGAKLFSPNNTQLRIESKKTVAHVVNRSKFDQTLYEEAMKAGAKVKLNNSVMSIRGNTIFTQINGRGGIEKSKLIVAADGVNSKLRKQTGFEQKTNDFIHSYQVKASGHFDPDFVELYFGEKFAPHFFAWIIPENESTAKVGIGCKMGLNPVYAFNQFLKEKQINIHVKEGNSFLIPCSPPIKTLYKENLILLGDSAYMTKSTTGGGITMNCKAADILSGVIDDHLNKNVSLDAYHERMKPIFNELKLHWKIHQFQIGINDSEMNRFFLKLKDVGMEEFLSKEGDMDEPTQFIGKLSQNPRMISLLPEAIKFWTTR